MGDRLLRRPAALHAATLTPSLQAPAVLDVVPRMRDIERRLRDCMARGEQPAPAVLADALHEAGGALLLIVEAEERITAAEEAAGRREARYMDAEVRLTGLLFEVEARVADLRSLIAQRDSAG